MEHWKPLRETDQYEASTEGRIRNSETGRILVGTVSSAGRLRVLLHINGRVCSRYVSRIVAEAFWGSECDGYDVYHRDCNLLNNRLSNLAIGTRSEAIRNSYVYGNRTNKGYPIRCVETGTAYRTISECSKALGINRATISKCANYPNCYNNTHDYHFEFVDD